MQYINFSAVNRLQPDFSSPSFSIKYVLYFLYLYLRTHLPNPPCWDQSYDSILKNHMVLVNPFCREINQNAESTSPR